MLNNKFLIIATVFLNITALSYAVIPIGEEPKALSTNSNDETKTSLTPTKSSEPVRSVEQIMHDDPDDVVYSKTKEFVKLAMKHKKEWMEYLEDKYEDKFKLKQKLLDKKEEYLLDHLDEMKDGYSTAKGTNNLDAMIALHEQKAQEWKQWCQEYYQKGEKLHDKQMAELTQFKASWEGAKPMSAN